MAKAKSKAKKRLKPRVTTILGVTLGLILLIVLGVWFWTNKAWLPHTNRIVLTENGFKPQNIRVKPGETVHFVNQTEKRMWPASDPHPKHSDYAGFDPLDFVDPGEEWSFTFTEAGLWHFHDHIAPAFRGSILVQQPGKIWFTSGACSGVTKESSIAELQRCWDDQILKAYKSGGVAKAFDKLKDLYKTQPAFAETCHSQAHLIGDIFYVNYSRDQKASMLDLPQETVYCGYGFYHGLFEHFFRDNPDLKLINNFCDQLTEQLGETVPRIRLNCFHGAGHGLVPIPTDKADWGKPQQLVDPALDLCEQLSSNLGESRECMQGAFNVLTAWIFGREYGLEPDENNFLNVCNQQTNRERQLACFYELAMYLGSYPAEPEKVIEQFILSVDDLDIAKVSLNVMVASWMQAGVAEPDHTRYINICNGLPENLQWNCLEGLIGGLMAHGMPDREYEKGLAFCRNLAIKPDFLEGCYNHLTNKFKETYPIEKVQSICQDIPDEYQHFCQ